MKFKFNWPSVWSTQLKESPFCGLILAASKSGEILMPNDSIALGFCTYNSTQFGGNVTS